MRDGDGKMALTWRSSNALMDMNFVGLGRGREVYAGERQARVPQYTIFGSSIRH